MRLGDSGRQTVGVFGRVEASHAIEVAPKAEVHTKRIVLHHTGLEVVGSSKARVRLAVIEGNIDG